MHRGLSLVELFAVFIVGSVSASGQQSAAFEGLGHLPGGAVSTVLGVSADGTTAVGSAASTEGLDGEAFRWTRIDGLVGLGDLPGSAFYSTANAVSADGSVIVGAGVSTSGVREAFRWRRDLGLVGLGDVQGDPFYSEALGISGDGRLALGYGSVGTSVKAVCWSPSRSFTLGDLPGGAETSVAIDASTDGSVIVGLSVSAASDPAGEAFRWTLASGLVGLGDLPGGSFESVASAVSNDGSVIVGSGTSASGPEAFRWTEADGLVGLGDLPGGDSFSRATAVSADGSVVVGFSIDDSSSFGAAFVWDAAHGMRSLRSILVDDYGLDLSGWTLFDAMGVSADGLTIVGNARNPDGDTEAWIATLPEAAFAPPGS